MNILGLTLGGVAVAGAALFAWQITQPAPEPQGHSMETPDTSRIEAGAPIVKVALPAELSDDATMGQRAFDAYCAQCHGANAAGQNGVAPPLVHKIYEPSHHGDAAFLSAAQNGVRAHHWKFGNMPPVEGLTGAEVKYIVSYVRALQEANGIR